MAIAERWKGFRELSTDIRQRLKKLFPFFEREGVLLAYLSGSSRRRKEGQDVDLAILARDGLAFRLREGIAECLGTERVDLVDSQCAPPMLRFEIIHTGRPIYVADKTMRERFELATLHLYKDTHPFRRINWLISKGDWDYDPETGGS